MKKLLFALTVAIALASCSEEISEVTHESRMLSFYIEEDGGNTRAITSGMSTTFEVGDVAGVFAVKDGKVLEDFNNVPLTYQQTGSWQMATATEYSKELEGVKFYAYYPYDANMSFDASIADPFNDYVNNFYPTLKQATKSGYEAADLMTSQATPIGELNDVRIKMKHRMAMANVELPNQAYTFTNEGMEPYVLKSASHCSFTLGGENVFPYFDKGSQTYRIITKPNSENQLQLSYIDGNTEKEVALDLSILSSGQAHIYKVDGGANIQSFTLQIGDYLCQDGSFVKQRHPTQYRRRQEGDRCGLSLGDSSVLARRLSRCNPCRGHRLKDWLIHRQGRHGTMGRYQRPRLCLEGLVLDLWNQCLGGKNQ